MSLRGWFQPGYRLLLMFFATTAVLVAALAWMGWKLVQQERLLSRQRLEERRDRAAALAVTALKEDLSRSETELLRVIAVAQADWRPLANSIASTLPGDSALLVFSSSRLEAFPSGRLLYYPDVLPGPAVPPAVFASTEELEFQKRDYLGAAAGLRDPARSGDPQIRAEALARLGRCLWKAGKPAEALAAYNELERAGTVPVSGLPAELVARESRLLLLERQKSGDVRREAAALDSALRSGKWRIGRTAYEFYMEEAARILGSNPPAPETGISAAAETLYLEWPALSRGGGSSAGRRIFWCRDRPWLLLWQGSAERMAVLALGRGFLESTWLDALKPALDPIRAKLLLSDADGREVSGSLPKEVPFSVHLPSATGLPWTLHTVSIPPAEPGLGAQRLIFTGLLTLTLLVLAGGYFIGRAAAREVAVARLQSDFVASVSHEFRTPVTAMRQLSELLATGRVAGDEDRNEYYQALVQESGRLHRLVEGLLTFGRMEAGAMHFRFEPLDAGRFAEAVAAEFRREAGARGHRVELRVDAPIPPVRGDRAALGCVLWNLLDNAVKYSPECPAVWVEVAHEDQNVVFRVRDRGIGIPAAEQREIFKKFTRGAAARAGGIQGAGVGLAMARQIVAAHHGELRVESRPGEGSTFTVTLPALNT